MVVRISLHLGIDQCALEWILSHNFPSNDGVRQGSVFSAIIYNLHWWSACGACKKRYWIFVHGGILVCYCISYTAPSCTICSMAHGSCFEPVLSLPVHILLFLMHRIIRHCLLSFLCSSSRRGHTDFIYNGERVMYLKTYLHMYNLVIIAVQQSMCCKANPVPRSYEPQIKNIETLPKLLSLFIWFLLVLCGQLKLCVSIVCILGHACHGGYLLPLPLVTKVKFNYRLPERCM